MFDMDGEILDGIMSSILIESRASRKLKNGEELTPEEQDKLLQVIYRSALNGLKDQKKMNNTKAKLACRFVTFASRLYGEQMEGYGEAFECTRRCLSYGVDNYKRILAGVEITSNNAIRENFMTLLEQNKEVDNFNGAFIDLYEEIQERGTSYKKDYKSPIGEEEQQTLKLSRLRIVELSGKYIPKK